MAFIQDSLSGLSTRPILIFALPILILGAGWHFFTTYQDCSEHAELRARLGAAIAASAESGTLVEIARITDFPWERADILVNYKPEGATDDCPFGWDWSRAEREKLIAADLLTVIVFLNGGRLVNYLEYPRDQADFARVQNPYTPGTARFEATPSPDGASRFVLSPAP
jgi:hypothetical protein